MTPLASNLVLGLMIGGCTADVGTDTGRSPTGDSGRLDPLDILDVASAHGSFDTLVQAMLDAGLEDTFRGTGPFTVFAPTDKAFTDLGVDLGTLSQAELAELVAYHVVAAEIPSTAVPRLAGSLADYTLFFDVSSGVVVNDATVTAPDLEANNGVIHAIDGVLQPPNLPAAAAYAGLSNLSATVAAASPGVAQTLASDGPLTVFAPTDAAFDTFNASLPAALSADELSAVLSYHLVGGEMRTDDLPAHADTLLTNEWGHGVTALFDTTSRVMVNGTASVLIADVVTTNGVMHVVDQLLAPPTVVDLAANAGLSGLLATVGAASDDLGATLSGAGSVTLFAPTNQAFTDFASEAQALDADQLRDVLLFHIVDSATPVVTSTLASGDVPTLVGQPVAVDVRATIMVENATVVTADLHVTNGVVHIIDTVLVPDL